MCPYSVHSIIYVRTCVEILDNLWEYFMTYDGLIPAYPDGLIGSLLLKKIKKRKETHMEAISYVHMSYVSPENINPFARALVSEKVANFRTHERQTQNGICRTMNPHCGQSTEQLVAVQIRAWVLPAI